VLSPAPGDPPDASTPTARRRAAVLGSPVAHSLSPALHRAAYTHLGLREWTYESHELVAGQLPDFLAGLDRSWAGLSLTMPLKEAALAAASSASRLAAELGNANTLTPTEGGWHADNTDVEGVRRALLGAGTPVPASAVLVGSGATARSAVAALDALGVRELTFVVRSELRAATAAQCRSRGLPARVVRYAECAPVLAGAGLVVSTVPAGAADPLAEALTTQPVDGSGRQPVVLDVVYAGWPTRLAVVCRDRGALVVSGLELLVHQAVEQVRLMTGASVAPEVLRAAGLAALSGPPAAGGAAR
jgi:shikimate dehydrogenase